MFSCQVCWRIIRWHNGRTRRSRNLSHRKSPKTANLNRTRAQRIPSRPRGLLLPKRPYTFAQTITSSSFFACDRAADHTYCESSSESETANGCLVLPSAGTDAERHTVRIEHPGTVDLHALASVPGTPVPPLDR